MPYDTKCYDLAAAFLEDYTLTPDAREQETDRLATLIQQTIELELESLQDLREPSPDSEPHLMDTLLHWTTRKRP